MDNSGGNVALLQFAINAGIIDLPSVEKQIEMNMRNKYLEKHTHAVWQATDGKWCTYLPDETKPKGRALCKRKSREDVEDAIVAYWKSLEDNPTIEEVFNEWIEARLQRQQIKPATVTRNQVMFKRFFKEFGNKHIGDVTPIEWEDFLCGCIAEYHLNMKAFNNLKTITRGFLKRAKKNGLITMEVERFFLELDISDHDFAKTTYSDADEAFYDDEIEKIMEYIVANQCPANMAIALMFVSGIRVGELVCLKHEDFSGTTFQIKRTETRYRKDAHHFECKVDEFPKTPAGYRTVFIPNAQKWIIDRIMQFNPTGDYIFLDNRGNRMHTEMIRRNLRTICRNVGIPERSPHKIRKTYGSILLDNNIDNKTIEGQMGHTNITCTERFYHRNRRRNEQKQKIFDAIPEFTSMGINN